MGATLTPGKVTFAVEFAGLCLYVMRRKVRPKPEETRPPDEVGVLMPTCVPTPDGRVNTKHEDGEIGARHVPYLLMDLASLDIGQRVTAGFVADGPRFQVVRRLNREEISFFDPRQPKRSIVDLVPNPRPFVDLDPNPLPLPDLSVYNDRIGLNGALLSNIGKDERPELNVRTMLKGGTLTATPLGGSGRRNPAKGQGLKWHKLEGDWAGSIIWKLEGLPDQPIGIRIQGWGKDQNDAELELRPVPVPKSDEKIIKLKIANLCETNSLEWREFEHRLQREDVDFKWLFRLFESKDGLLKAVGRKKYFGVIGGRKFPYPKLTPREARTTGSAGCTGGQFGLP